MIERYIVKKYIKERLVENITLLDGKNSTGISSVAEVVDYNNLNVHIISTGVSSGATVEIQGSLDGSNYYTINPTSKTISSNGVVEVSTTNKYNFLRANVSALTDGTYSVELIGSN